MQAATPWGRWARGRRGKYSSNKIIIHCNHFASQHLSVQFCNESSIVFLWNVVDVKMGSRCRWPTQVGAEQSPANGKRPHLSTTSASHSLHLQHFHSRMFFSSQMIPKCRCFTMKLLLEVYLGAKGWMNQQQLIVWDVAPSLCLHNADMVHFSFGDVL